MSERYIRLQEIIFDTYLLDAPVEIEKGALLLDTQTDVVLLQLRLNILNYGIVGISSVALDIEALDDAGETIPYLKPFDNTFRDVNLLGTMSFGDKSPIVLDPRVRRVKVEIEKVTFTEGNSWRPAGKKLHPPEQKPINSISTDLHEQLDRDIGSIASEIKQRINFFPQELDEYWLCVCGRPNDNQIVDCCRCGIEKNWMFENINEEIILKNLKNFNEIKEENNARSLHRRKIFARTFLILIVIGLISLLFFYVVLPFFQYSRASHLLENKQYDSAITAFEALGDYKDSKEMIKEVNYQKANEFLSDKQYDESIKIFTFNEDYKDTCELINEAKFQKANDLLKYDKYDEAIAIYKNIEGYKNSKEMLKEANYQKARDLLSNKKFDESIQIFSELLDFNDSEVMVNEAKYQKANNLVLEKQYSTAISYFIELGNFKDSASQILKTKYKAGNQYLIENNYENAVLSFLELGKYNDAENLLKEAKYSLAKQKAEGSKFEEAIVLFKEIGNYKDSETLLEQTEKSLEQKIRNINALGDPYYSGGAYKYEVEMYDSCLSIAIKFGVSLEALNDINGFVGCPIYTGQVILIPAPGN